jgi:hypothetical protein
MATLHVRNVPDELYERLRERAAANGRSIGAEVVVVLETELGHGGARPWRSMFSRRRYAPTPFHRFTPQARNVVAQAKEEARELGDAAIGTEHLLLALLRAPGPVALFVLDSSGLDYAQARSAVAEVQRDRADEPSGLPFTPGAKKAMELALRYCIELRSSQIGPEHLLLGIAREEDGLGARILAGAGLDVPTLRRGLAVPSELQPYELRVEGHGFRVVELTGDAPDWERQLNSLAARGYELVEIVTGKAIFRVPVPEP